MSDIRLECRPMMRQAQLPTLEADAPPDAVHGLQGLVAAHKILLQRQIPGLLIGGTARTAWLAKKRDNLCHRKDVDVVVLSFDEGRHPERFEGGIDWWCTTSPNGGPTNGNGVQLIWCVWPGIDLPPGLYLTPMELLLLWRLEEKRVFADEFYVKIPFRVQDGTAWRQRPLIHEYRALTVHDLRWSFTSQSSE